MAFKEYNHCSKPLFNELQMLNIYQINDYTIAILTNQFINNQLPISLKNIFKTNEDVHYYNTPSTKKLHKPFIKTNIRKLSISYKGVDIFNNLPSDLKETRCQSTFKRKLKNFILTNQM